jgi:hypothetical protein
MGVALSSLQENDTYFYIYTAGPAKINSMVMEFVNVSERNMKVRGKKIKMYKVPPSWIQENMESINYFAFLSNPNEPVSGLVKEAESKNIEVGIFRY